MIIERIIENTLIPTLTGTSRLDWVQQYGYMVRPQTRRVQTGDNAFTDVVYPVARHVAEQDCEEPTFENLNPDHSKRSIMYFEALGGMAITPNEQIPERRGVTFSQNIAVKVWLNHAKMGTEGGNDGPPALDVVRAFHGQKYKNVNFPLILGDLVVDYGTIAKMKVLWTGELDQTPQAVFGAYTFSRDQALLHGDYSFFGLTFNLSGILIAACGFDGYSYDYVNVPAC